MVHTIQVYIGSLQALLSPCYTVCHRVQFFPQKMKAWFTAQRKHLCDWATKAGRGFVVIPRKQPVEQLVYMGKLYRWREGVMETEVKQEDGDSLDGESSGVVLKSVTPSIYVCVSPHHQDLSRSKSDIKLASFLLLPSTKPAYLTRCFTLPSSYSEFLRFFLALGSSQAASGNHNGNANPN